MKKFSPEIENFLEFLDDVDLSNFAVDIESFQTEIARLEAEIEQEEKTTTKPKTFRQRVTAEDRLRAHGMGIRLD